MTFAAAMEKTVQIEGTESTKLSAALDKPVEDIARKSAGLVARICNHSAWESGAGVRGLPGLQSDTLFPKETKGGRMRGREEKPEVFSYKAACDGEDGRTQNSVSLNQKWPEMLMLGQKVRH